MTRKSSTPRRPYVRFTRWRRAHFFRVLEETGHAQMAAEAAGVSLGCIYRLRRVEAGFTEKMIARRPGPMPDWPPAGRPIRPGRGPWSSGAESADG